MKKNKPSATALFVANGMYYNIHQEALRADVPEDMKKYAAQLMEHCYGIKGGSSRQWRLMIAAVLQFFSVKGFFLHFLLRKKCIEKQVKEAIEQGFEQVVVLGAGYDTLCSRLAVQHPNVNFIELDHPATAASKTALFMELEWKKSNIHYLAQDLKHIEKVFESDVIQKNTKTIFVCEGVFMYLQQKEVEQVFAAIHEDFKAECKFVFTFMEEQKLGDYQFKNATAFVKLLLRFKNEPFTWGIKSEKMALFLANKGWKLQRVFDYEKLKSDFLSKENRHLSTAIGENVALCTKS